ncbi:hypothetical protein MTO96_047270 [Rhipicephalus appendiculatus]
MSVLDPAVGLRQLSDSAYFNELRGTVLDVRWSDTEDPVPAYLLNIGEPRNLHRNHAKVASASAIAGSPLPLRSMTVRLLLPARM